MFLKYVFKWFLKCVFCVFKRILKCVFHVFKWFLKCVLCVFKWFLKCVFRMFKRFLKYVFKWFLKCVLHVFKWFLKCVFRVFKRFLPELQGLRRGTIALVRELLWIPGSAESPQLRTIKNMCGSPATEMHLLAWWAGLALGGQGC